MRNIKQELYQLCREYLEERILNARAAIAASQESANNETKSSSGDKYETGRAMMQLEIEKDSAQLAESLKMQRALDLIRIDNTPATVQPGSLVSTNQGSFFVAVGVGKLAVDDKTYFVISPSSPIGVKMLGMRTKDCFTLNNRNYVVEQIQ
jgi:transcription elongation GreA/GreB family factor